MPKIALLDDYQNIALQMADWNRLPKNVDITVFQDHLDKGNTLISRLLPFDIIGAMRERTPFPRDLLTRLPKLKLLVTTGMKNASVDVVAAKELGITVCGTESLGHTTVEHTWSLILALARNIPQDDKTTRNGRWQTRLCTELHGKTLGVVGLGRIGKRVASIAQAFGMQVLAWSQNLSAEQAQENGVEYADKASLLRRSDIVTLHLRLSERTQGLVGAKELALMKPSALLVNTSRGPIVDEQALLDVLCKQRIGGAALDVYDHEPLPADHPFLTLDNMVLTPHTGFVSDDTYRVFYGQMLEDIEAWLMDKPIRILSA